MNQYYLMSQLPSLDGLGDSAPLPITEEDFLKICSRFLSEKSLKILRQLTLMPPRDEVSSGSALVDAWNRGERLLRLALGSVRAGSLKKDFDAGEESISTPLLQAAQTAVELEDPLAAERFLQQYRLRFLDSLRPLDEFCEDFVFYYSLKLKLLGRMRLFDEEKGREAYRNIYDSILRGDSQEKE